MSQTFHMLPQVFLWWVSLVFCTALIWLSLRQHQDPWSFIQDSPHLFAEGAFIGGSGSASQGPSRLICIRSCRCNPGTVDEVRWRALPPTWRLKKTPTSLWHHLRTIFTRDTVNKLWNYAVPPKWPHSDTDRNDYNHIVIKLLFT